MQYIMETIIIDLVKAKRPPHPMKKRLNTGMTLWKIGQKKMSLKIGNMMIEYFQVFIFV